MMLPTYDYRRTHLSAPRKLYKGLDRFVYSLSGYYHRSRLVLKDFQTKSQKVVELTHTYRHVSEARLSRKIQELKSVYRCPGKSNDSQLIGALALLAEAARRSIGLNPYPVQIIGALALHYGCLAEMATGEGKSLTACFPAIIAAWSGRPFHYVTTNDYLAGRDAFEMNPLYKFCGVSVASVTSEMEPAERRENYAKGVVYTTSKELVADFLRDRIIMGKLQQATRRIIRQILSPYQSDHNRLVMRGLHTALVDEADSVLIDEAVTPLIISKARENKPMIETSKIMSEVSQSLVLGVDYTADSKYKEIRLKKEGSNKINQIADSLPGLWKSPSRREEFMKQALSAREFFKKDKHYVIQDQKIVIVDEFTGRLMPNRTWRQGLHQAVEAQEGLPITNPSETLSRLSFQNFFRYFKHLSGMTGTAKENQEEFWQIYGLPTITIPTNKPCIRKLFKDHGFSTKKEKWEAIVQEIKLVNQTGCPILIGTRNIQSSETLGNMLAAENLKCNILNAVRHAEEAEIVANAGDHGRITVATNMAGRGTDIKLKPKIAKLGGLHVISTERNESARIDRQLFGRCARQGDPGCARVFYSLEDGLFQKFVSKNVRQALSYSLSQNIPGAQQAAQKTVMKAQRYAQRHAYKQRVNVLSADIWFEDSLAFGDTEIRN